MDTAGVNYFQFPLFCALVSYHAQSLRASFISASHALESSRNGGKLRGVCHTALDDVDYARERSSTRAIGRGAWHKKFGDTESSIWMRYSSIGVELVLVLDELL